MQNLQKLRMGTAECTGNVHDMNRVLNCTCKVLLRQEIHLTLADAKATGGDRKNNVAGKKNRLTDTAKYRNCLLLGELPVNCITVCLSASNTECLK